MSSEYTPTTDEVYAAIADAAPGWGLSELDDADALTRWLAAHDREVEARLRADYGLRSVVDVERAAAAKALREFGDMLEDEATNGDWKPERDVALFSWAAEAHHIADGIEEGS